MSILDILMGGARTSRAYGLPALREAAPGFVDALPALGKARRVAARGRTVEDVMNSEFLGGGRLHHGDATGMPGLELLMLRTGGRGGDAGLPLKMGAIAGGATAGIPALLYGLDAWKKHDAQAYRENQWLEHATSESDQLAEALAQLLSADRKHTLGGPK